MANAIGKRNAGESAAYFLVALLASGILFYLHSFRPETYVRFITEDQWGEYGTFVFLGLGGVLLLILSRKRISPPKKYLCILAGTILVFVAAEEISWGQRILHIPVPSFFKQLNSQGELNLHNVDVFDSLNRSGLHRGTGLLILGWSLGSALVSLFAPASARKMGDSGVPLIPIRLLPLFLLVPFFLLGRPVVKADEIGELFLGMAAAGWALHLFLENRPKSRPAESRLVPTLGFFALGGALTVALTFLFPGPLKWRLNMSAVRDYPGFRMYAQAERLFEYIYENPQYLLPQTRINHGRMLLERGNDERGFQVLTAALEGLTGPESEEDEGDFLRRKGMIHLMLGQSEEAEEDFRQALEIGAAQVESSTDPDMKAERMWSVALTLSAAGRPSEALETARKAVETAVSEKLRGKVERWILSQGEPSEEELPPGSQTL